MIIIKINQLKNKVDSEEEAHMVINLFSQNFIRKSSEFCVDNHVTFVELVKTFYNISRINLLNMLAAGDILVQIIGAIHGMYRKNYM